MRLDALLLADHAQVGDAGKLYVSGGWITRIGVDTLPGRIAPVTIVARFLIEPVDIGRQHEIRVSFNGPTGEQIAELPPGEIGPLEPKSHEFEDQAFAVIAQLIGLPVSEEGRHVIRVIVDDAPVGEIGVAIVRQAEAG